jgi:hypothetical protein
MIINHRLCDPGAFCEMAECQGFCAFFPNDLPGHLNQLGIAFLP